MTLLSKASTITTPTAYSEGLLHSVKPAVNLGSELITNGDFSDGTNNWTASNATLSIDGGALKITSTGGNRPQAYQIISGLTVGRKYRASAIGKRGTTTNQIEVEISGIASTVTTNLNLTTEYAFMYYDFVATATSHTIQAKIDDGAEPVGTTAFFQSVSVKEIIGADFDFARASSATRVNEQGLIEKGRENLLLQSNQFDTTWINSNSTETSGQSGYDGTNDAWLIDITAAGGFIYQSVSQSGVQTFSCYAKAGSVNFLRILGITSGTNPYAYFNLSTGTISVANSACIDASIDDIGSGWYRCSITFSDTISQVRFYPAIASEDLTATSGNIYIQDAQLEQGLVATDYIETTTSSVAVGITNDIPRINYENGIGNFLLEPQRTNLITQSEYLDDIFVATNITQTTNYGISPDGNLTSTRLELDNLTDSRTVETFTGIVTSGVTYTFSCYYKGVSGETTYMYFLDSNGITSVSKKITFTGQWQREFITFIAGTASNYTYLVDTRQGSSTAQDFEVWGAMLEAGSYPTSYIPCYGAATTRAAETCNNAGNSDLFNDSEGVLYAEIAALDSSIRQLSISDSTTANAIKFLYLTSNVFSFQIRDSLATTVNLSQTLDNVTDTIKAAGKYKSGDFALWINGFEVATTSTGTIPTGMSKLAYDAGDGGYPVYGKTKMLSTFKEALSDSELECLTSWSSFERMATAQNYTIE